MSELTASGNVPSLDEVRDKIEARYAKALGGAELASSSVEGRMLEVERSAMDLAGQSRHRLRNYFGTPARSCARSNAGCLRRPG